MTDLTRRALPLSAFAADKKLSAPAICRPVPICKLPGIPRDTLGYCPLPLHKTAADLTAELTAAPQFSKVRPDRLLDQQRGRLQLILLTESDYYARQAALYLAALNHLRRQASPSGRAENDDYWDSPILFDLLDADSDNAPSPLPTALAVVSASALDPEQQPQSEKHPSAPQNVIGLAKLDAPAILITSQQPALLSKGVLDQLDSLNDDPAKVTDLFIALRPEQVDLETIEELRFRWGYQVCRIGRPDQAYLRRVLTTLAEDLLMPLAPEADLDAVIAHARTLRGAQFDESDLERLIVWAVQRNIRPPLQTHDLLFTPLSLRQNARQALEEMVGLENVKDVLRRLLARMQLDHKRIQRRLPAAPVCRNLAFSGPPGTGKSVTARLLARAMQEAGCGSGRFVEAGREQLIGPYLGQTSPMIAKLFRQAKGGVLFIDEAGALLDPTGQDNYAAEAVNALVRHMELCPETLVIFATYPDEMQTLLHSNPGLASRIAHVLDFPGYSNDQLCDILALMAKKESYRLPSGHAALCSPYFDRLRKCSGACFGNGREVRRLFQTAVEELALRTGDSDALDLALCEADLRKAIDRLSSAVKENTAGRIGF